MDIFLLKLHLLFAVANLFSLHLAAPAPNATTSRSTSLVGEMSESDTQNRKALKRLGEDPGDKVMSDMYQALRKTHQRISPEMWKNYKKKQFKASIARVVFVVPRGNAQAIAHLADHPDYLIQPDELDQRPPNVDENTVIYVDSGCPRSVLGPGVN